LSEKGRLKPIASKDLSSPKWGSVKVLPNIILNLS
jgi:hypothetical protein